MTDATQTPERGQAPQAAPRNRQRHLPVLINEALQYLEPRAGGTYLDATLGLGGHAAAIAERIGPDATLWGFDRDPAAFALATERLQALEGGPNLELRNRPFSAAGGEVPPASLDGILADFGVSSMQIDTAERGFSFMADGPLDMRMDTQRGTTAEQVVNQAGEKQLADLIYEFGEERRSRSIARAIVRARPVTTTAQLAGIVSAAARSMKGDRIHPATRTFQALRIFVNRELEEIQALLAASVSLLRPGGRLVCISFHSLEDRLVKDAMRDGARQGMFEVLTKKPVTAGEEEMDINPRARSAKLRAAEKQGRAGTRQ